MLREAQQADHEAAEAAKGRRLRREAKVRRKKRRLLGLGSDESGSEAERQRGVWNGNNPDIRFLSVEGRRVRFVSELFADHCVALTLRPMLFGRHFYEFQVSFREELRCGVTTDAVQAGALVAGQNLRGWCYFTGRGKAGLQVNGKAWALF